MPQILNEEIISNEKIAEGIYKIIFKSQYVAQNAKPGQFINIKCSDGLDAYLRRPVSICAVDKKENAVTIVFQIKGKGTQLLSNKKQGDMLDIIGPLGYGNFSTQQNKRVIVVGGGVGIFPLYELLKQLNGVCDERIAILGFRNKDLVVMEKEFKSECENLLIATDDGSYGVKGFTTNLLLEQIKKHTIDMIYTCGPLPMIKKVAQIAAENNINCEVSLEERMGCGIGACLVCACKTKKDDNTIGNSHVCYDGPVFNAREVIFND